MGDRNVEKEKSEDKVLTIYIESKGKGIKEQLKNLSNKLNQKLPLYSNMRTE